MDNYWNSLNVLESLASKGIYNIDKIEWWLLKHEKLYVKSKQHNESEHLYEIDGETVRLPDNIGNPTDEEKFIDAYERLETLAEFQRNEDYFKQEMAIYNSIKNNPDKVNQWLKRNEKLGADEYACFLLDYLDYDSNDNEYHLNVFFAENKDLEVLVDREDFKYTLEFLDVFNNLYWIRQEQ